MADDSNKTEKATPFKLKEAKKKGQVSKSIEVTSLLMFVLFSATIFMVGNQIWSSLQIQMHNLLVQSAQIPITNGTVITLMRNITFNVAETLTPIFLVLVIGAVIFNIIQTGPILSSHPIKPDWKRINPVQGLKKIFSIKTLFDLFKALLKVAIIVFVWIVFGDMWLQSILNSYGMTQNGLIIHWVDLSFSLILLLIAVLLPHALLDLAFTRWDFAKQMRMSQQDIKDEYKKREGDPQIKQKQKQIQKELLKKASSLKSVKDADVIITNPEHIAVAIKYVPGEMLAPKVLIMGADKTAAVIRKIARHHAVPIIRNIPLAREIHRNSVIDGYIPETCYVQVAEVLRKILNLDEIRRKEHKL